VGKCQHQTLKPQSVLNAAREVIAEADAAEQAPQAAETEAAAREWWAPVDPSIGHVTGTLQRNGLSAWELHQLARLCCVSCSGASL
jgi:hypothetical protein